MFHEMRYVYAVYQEQSFSKAAEKLYISQPSLSAMVKRAEKRIGSDIFNRGTIPVTLTQIGEAYIAAVEKIMELETELRRYINDSSELLIGHLAIGGTTLFTSFILPALIAGFTKRYPGVNIQICEANTQHLEKELEEGTLDFMIDNCEISTKIYNREIVCTEELLLAVPAAAAVNQTVGRFSLNASDIQKGRHLLADTEIAPFHAFQDEGFLLLKEGNDTRARAEKIFKRARFKPKIQFLLDQQMTTYNLACNNVGCAFVSDTLVKHMPATKEIVFYKLDHDLAKRHIYLYSRQSNYQTHAVKAFIEMAAKTPLSF
ncbi:MAG: LysR family transcriptional regulator [Sphaerochaeta sp.]|nr:LysR family transcriptional regulator [Sphaerochaeta sp.]